MYGEEKFIQEQLLEELKNLKSRIHELEESNKEQVKKVEIYNLLESILDISVSNKVLVDITFNEDDNNGAIILGRPPVTGSSTKQMRHLTPYSFVEQTIKDRVENANNMLDLFNNFRADIKYFLSDDTGICLTNKEDYINIKLSDFSKDIEYTFVETIGRQYYLISNNNLPEGWENVLGQEKIKAAQELYQKKKTKLVNYAIDILQNTIADDNTANIACEALARFMFTLFHQRPCIAFPEEGNTTNYEIRLYNSVNESKKHPKTSTWQVVKSYELMDMLKLSTEKKSPEITNGQIRIVCNEGSIVKKVVKALNILSEIITIYDQIKITKLISDYNAYNLLLKPNNRIKDIEIFKDCNNDLDLSKKILGQVTIQVAKNLYIVFDFKPLEDVVFVPSTSPELSQTIKVYTSAEGLKKQGSYTIMNGKKYREEQENSAKGYNDEAIFRSEVESDFNLLGEKALEHLTISLLPYNALIQNNETLNSIFDAFIQLITADYMIEKSQLGLDKHIKGTIFDIQTGYQSDTGSDIQDYYKGAWSFDDVPF